MNKHDGKIDFKICVDHSLSMSPFIHTLKESILYLLDDYVNELLTTKFFCEEKDVTCRVKFIIFSDKSEKIKESKFFDYQKEIEDISKYLDNIKASDKKITLSNAEDALYQALVGKWNNKDTYYKRYVVMLFSDNPSSFNRLEQLEKLLDYDNNLSIELNKRKLFMYTPNVSPFTELCSYDGTMLYFVKEGNGLTDINLKEINYVS